MQRIRSRAMARLRFVAGVLVGAVALRLLAGPGLVNYDTLYTLVWGRQLAHGELPDLEVAIAPTPHPLANLAAVLLSPLSSIETDGQRILSVLRVLNPDKLRGLVNPDAARREQRDAGR